MKAVAQAPQTVGAPVSLAQNDQVSLGLLSPGDSERIPSPQTNTLKVGDSPSDVEKIYPTPAASTSFKELPPGFQAPYRARGYETQHDGLGVIYYDNEVALAMHHEENLSSTDVDNETRAYTSLFGNPTSTLSGRQVRYWFWQVDQRRLMICATMDQHQKDRYDLTVAVGDSVVMDALRMNRAAASEDQPESDKIRTPSQPIRPY